MGELDFRMCHEFTSIQLDYMNIDAQIDTGFIWELVPEFPLVSLREY